MRTSEFSLMSIRVRRINVMLCYITLHMSCPWRSTVLFFMFGDYKYVVCAYIILLSVLHVPFLQVTLKILLF